MDIHERIQAIYDAGTDFWRNLRAFGNNEEYSRKPRFLLHYFRTL